jgi:serine protease Do
VRLSQIDDLDLNQFQFDLDLTFTVFFMNAEGQVYARYGSRDATSPDSRQSLAGLRYTMLSVLETWRREPQRVAPRRDPQPLFIHQLPAARGAGRCVHCHQAREILDAQLRLDGKWNAAAAFRYPLPDNLGFRLEVDRSNIVEEVTPGSPAERLGLKSGDRIGQIADVPTHSLADVQFALDGAPESGTIDVWWWRDGRLYEGTLELPPRWRRGDITWRASKYKLIALPRLFGPDLTAEEKRALGLSPERLAFREVPTVSEQARDAGIREGDIILGFDDQELNMTVREFWRYVRKNYVVGETVIVNLVRDGQPMRLPMTLR